MNHTPQHPLRLLQPQEGGAEAAGIAYRGLQGGGHLEEAEEEIGGLGELAGGNQPLQYPNAPIDTLQSLNQRPHSLQILPSDLPRLNPAHGLGTTSLHALDPDEQVLGTLKLVREGTFGELEAVIFQAAEFGEGGVVGGDLLFQMAEALLEGLLA